MYIRFNRGSFNASELATRCNSGGPFYRQGGLPLGTYSVWLTPPAGWQAIGGTRTANIDSDGDVENLWFGVQRALTAFLTANPMTINQGQSSTITWGSTNATSCSGINFNTSGATSGTVVVAPPTTTTYTVQCTNGSTNQSDSKTITVIVPAASIIAAPPRVFSGTVTSVTWSTTNVTPGSCTVTGTNGDSWNLDGGTQSTSPITQTTTYTLSCLDLIGNPVGDSVQITLKPQFDEQ
jgi:hypothetical protein